MLVSIGHSDDPSTGHAAEEVVARALEGLKGASPSAILVFASRLHDPAPLMASLRGALPRVPMIGCSTYGEMSSERGFLEDSLVLVLLSGVGARAALGPGLAHDVEGAVRRATTACAGPGVALALPAGITVNGSAVVDALGRHRPAGVRIAGACAADDWRFDRIVQFYDFEVHEGSMPLLWLQGPLCVGVGVGNGWAPISAPWTVTASEGNLVREVDGEPALAFFQRYFGEVLEPAPEYPVAIMEGESPRCLRAPIAYDPEEGGVRFTGDIPVGSVIRLCDADRAAILEGAGRSVEAALAGCPDPDLLLAFSCAARLRMLGTRTLEEPRQLRRALRGRPFAGFYGYGEFVVDDAGAVLHNQTLVCVSMRGSA